MSPELTYHYGASVPWQAIAAVICALVILAGYFGIRGAGRVLIITGSLEILVMIAIGLSGFVSPGAGGVNFGPFNPGNAPSFQGIYLGVVFTIFTYSGWETATPLAEESRQPRRNVQVALVLSVIIVGVMYLIASWGTIVGLGTTDAAKIATLAQNPFFVLVNKLWGPAWIVLLLALLNSGFATGLGGFNGATRIWYAMGRSGSLPRQLAVIHPKYRTPINAVRLQIIVVAGTFVVAWIWRPDNVLFVWALAFTLGLILVYMAIAVAVVKYFRFGDGRPEFNPVLHVLLPIVGFVAALWVGYKSVVPFPTGPTFYAPILFVVWILLGLGVIVMLSIRGRDAWLSEAGKAFDEIDFGSDEAEAKPIAAHDGTA